MAVQVFHTVDEAEAEGENCKAEDGTPISKQEADKQQLLKSAVTLFEQASLHPCLTKL
jgi:hypothetical protein